MSRYLLWDFDGTLAYREGMWSGALFDVLNKACPTLTVTREDLRNQLSSGFFWHSPEKAHLHIQTAEQWWAEMNSVFTQAYQAIGIHETMALSLAGEVRKQYRDLAYWHVYSDVVPMLTKLSTQGWKHVVLSNHIPELEDLISDLGLNNFFYRVYTSAKMGYEKPNAKTYQIVLEDIDPVTSVWMIGDNPVADVQGAEAVGIPAILVRKIHDGVNHVCSDLTNLPNILKG